MVKTSIKRTLAPNLVQGDLLGKWMTIMNAVFELSRKNWLSVASFTPNAYAPENQTNLIRLRKTAKGGKPNPPQIKL